MLMRPLSIAIVVIFSICLTDLVNCNGFFSKFMDDIGRNANKERIWTHSRGHYQHRRDSNNITKPHEPLRYFDLLPKEQQQQHHQQHQQDVMLTRAQMTTEPAPTEIAMFSPSPDTLKPMNMKRMSEVKIEIENDEPEENQESLSLASGSGGVEEEGSGQDPVIMGLAPEEMESSTVESLIEAETAAAVEAEETITSTSEPIHTAVPSVELDEPIHTAIPSFEITETMTMETQPEESEEMMKTYYISTTPRTEQRTSTW